MAQQENFRVYPSTDETLRVWARILNHIVSNLNNNAYVTIELTAGEISAVPDTRTVNGKQLNVDITLNSSDTGSVPTTRTVNGKALSSDISLTASDVGLGSGITQSITIPDVDGVNYHHLTFTAGVVTAYLKDTNP